MRLALMRLACDVTLIATNPNMKWDIYCDRLQPGLFYGLFFNYNPTGLRLASTSLRPLSLKSSNQTSVSFKLPMLSAYVPYDVAKEISDDNTTALAFREFESDNGSSSNRMRDTNMEIQTQDGAVSLTGQLNNYRWYQNEVVSMVGRAKANAILSGAIHLLSAGTSDFIQNYHMNESPS
ncbi:Hypothetical predicted protein [Prunus dulcis]|uniref:Uncharacterized protein n=1 Tax=Prunus dulcis TaxID=3755 RepID=A0A5E4E3U3_PRUDU|nr:Hypothetical predicted protein [Prunus dulcis]